MKLGYGTYAGIENATFESNRVLYAGLAIKISSRMGMGGRLRNITFVDTTVVRAGIGINVDLGVTKQLTPGGGPAGKSTDPRLLSTLDGLNITNLAAPSIGCLPSKFVTPGVYCGGAGCLIGSHLQPLGGISLRNVSMPPALGWNCLNATPLASATAVVPPPCRAQQAHHQTAAFFCSET